jgi:hypothetical protein
VSDASVPELRRDSILGTALVLSVLLLTGCPNGNGDGGGNGGSVSAGRDLSGVSFQTPSGNIGCRFYRGSLRCDILSGLKPDPGSKFADICPVDWTGLYIDPLKDAGPQCAGDSVFDGTEPTLEYGHTWSRGELTCDSKRTRLRCVDTAGNGFVLNRAGWKLLGRQAAARRGLR